MNILPPLKFINFLHLTKILTQNIYQFPYIFFKIYTKLQIKREHKNALKLFITQTFKLIIIISPIFTNLNPKSYINSII